MISKKNKVLTAGVLAAAMSATAMVPSFASAANEYATENGANESYAKMFESLYDDVITNGQKNGYLSKNDNGKDSFGIPYHVAETLCVEAPDYGHETTSEAMSYIAWITAMHDVLVENGKINGSTGDLKKGWKTLEAMIPGWSVNSYKGASGKEVDYKSLWSIKEIKADTTTEENDPSGYPAKQNGVNAYNPIFDDYKAAYSSENGYYMMHWLADVEDWYGFGGGSGKFVFINTFQRGEEESCFETVPHGAIEELKYGMDLTGGHYSKTGLKAVFNGWKEDGQVAPQYGFTNAPDAEDRAIQAIYFASQFGLDCGEISALAAKMGDQCRNDMFDKYYKAIGCQNIDSQSAGLDSQHFLMSWYTSWGGSTYPWYAENNPSGNFDWAYQIGCSHSHQFYQNPLAAYALAYDPVMSGAMASNGAKNAVSDYEKSFKRQIELYLWLQSAEGPYAGGCTNSKNGKYEKYGANESTFYDMVYVEHPVYADPGSNHWIGNQVWSTQRLAELYYYVKTKGDLTKGETFGGLSLEDALEALLSRWIDWFMDNTEFDFTAEDGTYMSYAIPSNLDWSGQPATWNKTYNESANSGLHCEITGYGQGDIGCVSSLCNTLIFYAAANNTPASAAQSDDNNDRGGKALRLANKLMSAQWNTARDEIGIAYVGTNGSLKRVFEQEVFVPDGFNGKMPDGSIVAPGATFSSLRTSYESDPMYQEAKDYYNGKGTDNNGDGKVDIEDYEFTLHRFWHMGDALMTTGTMALLYPEVTPINDDEPAGDLLWGDANVDGNVTIADATAILQHLGNQDKYGLTEKGALQGDVSKNGDGISVADANVLQQLDAGLVKQSELPVGGVGIGK